MYRQSRFFPLGFILIGLCLAALRLQAQPSGGPYGPILQTYEVPAEAGAVYYVAPDGDADAVGTSLDAPTTLASAIARVVTDDAIILRGGTYRTGDLHLNQGIWMQPYKDEQPVLKGTQVPTEWEALSGGLWRTEWETLFPLAPQPWWRDHRHLHETPRFMFNNDMVFVDGEPLTVKGYPAELEAGDFCVDYDEGYVYIAVDPAKHTVEVTAFDNALTRVITDVHGKSNDRVGPRIRGIVFTQYAYRAIEIEGYNPEGVSPESEHGKDVVGTVIEHCTFSHCSRVGAYLRGDHMVIRHNLVSDTATEGLFVLSSSDVLIERNIFTRNNMEGIHGYYATALKIFNQCYRVTANENLVIDNPDSCGIWYDVGNVDGVFTNNWVERTWSGFFFEISKGVRAAGNVFVDCLVGTRILNSSGAKVYQNTYINSASVFDRTPRSAEGDHFDWHPASGPDVDERHSHAFEHNLIVVTPDFPLPLHATWQTDELADRLTDEMMDHSDHNVYVRTGRLPAGDFSGMERNLRYYYQRGRPLEGTPLLAWSPADNDISHRTFDTLEDFHAMGTGFEENSVFFERYDGTLFQGPRLSRYGLEPAFAEQVQLPPLPADIAEIAAPIYRDARFPGAFPPVETE